MDNKTEILYRRAIRRAVGSVRSGHRSILFVEYEDEQGATHEFELGRVSRDEVATKLGDLLRPKNAVRFAAAGELGVLGLTGEPIHAVSVYWQDRSHDVVQLRAIAYWERGLEFRLDQTPMDWPPLSESFLA